MFLGKYRQFVFTHRVAAEKLSNLGSEHWSGGEHDPFQQGDISPRHFVFVLEGDEVCSKPFFCSRSYGVKPHVGVKINC